MCAAESDPFKFMLLSRLQHLQIQEGGFGEKLVYFRLKFYPVNYIFAFLLFTLCL